jgi:hypothetical protein
MKKTKLINKNMNDKAWYFLAFLTGVSLGFILGWILTKSFFIC